MKAKRPFGTVCLQAAAKLLISRGTGSGPKEIFGQLRELGWLEGHEASWKALRAGWLKEEAGGFIHGEGGEDTYKRVFITREGIDKLERELKEREWRPRTELDLPDCILEM